MAPENSDPTIRYAQDAAAAEGALQTQLDSFASDCDDDEVRSAFQLHAALCGANGRRLREAIGAAAPAGKETAAHAMASGPRTLEFLHIQEERTVQHLIAGYTLLAGACGMYEAMAAVANEAGRQTLAELALQIQASKRQGAAQLFHFIHTRAIIAYNMLTVSEVDPSVETKIGEASWTE